MGRGLKKRVGLSRVWHLGHRGRSSGKRDMEIGW